MAKTSLSVHEVEARDHAKDEAVAARVAWISAEIDRLDAIGHGVAGLAGLGRGFNFMRLPGEGGPKPVREVPWTRRGLAAATQTLSKRVWRLSDALLALRGYLLNIKLASQIVPHGHPLGHGWISSPWGWRPDPFDPLHGKWEFHPGIDFADQEGSTIHAIAAGVVTWAGPRYGYGNLVIVNDGNGYTTYYAHAEKVLVSVGEVVRRGEPLALVGDTGRSTGPHLFLEVRYKGHPVNPAKYVASRSVVSGLASLGTSGQS